MKNIVTLAVVGMVLWNGTIKLAEFTLKNRKEINRVCAEVRGMPINVAARAVETDNVINWAAKNTH